MAAIEIFEDDAFSVPALTAAINEQPFVPGRLAELGLFEEEAPAWPRAHRGMRMSTLEQLRNEWTTPCPTLTAVRERYFPHIGSDRRFKELINKGRIDLQLSKIDSSKKAQHVIYLHNLAAYLDRQAERST